MFVNSFVIFFADVIFLAKEKNIKEKAMSALHDSNYLLHSHYLEQNIITLTIGPSRFHVLLCELRRQSSSSSSSPSPIIFVMGNEAMDLDSHVSSIAFAYLRHKIQLSRSDVEGVTTRYIPILNLEREDFVLRGECVTLFEILRISLEDLIFLGLLTFSLFGKYVQTRYAHTCVTYFQWIDPLRKYAHTLRHISFPYNSLDIF